MLNENRSHKQQHCLKGKGDGRNIMARIVRLIDCLEIVINKLICLNLDLDLESK